MSTTIRIAHSPDADDAFMFYALLNGKIETPPNVQFVDTKEDIESLNQRAMKGEYEVSAVSFHVYPYIAGKYYLLSTGACFGDKYGPIVVAAKALKPKQLLKVRMAIPGKMTSAFLALKLYEHHLAGEAKSGICYTQVPFDKIVDEVKEKKVDAGLIIHEGQLTFSDEGLHKLVDLGEWWNKQTDLPLPLGGIIIRRDLDPEVIKAVGEAIQKSIVYALEHKEEALAYAQPFARGMDAERAKQFIGMYVNDWTVDFGRAGYKAIKTFLDRGYREGILKEPVSLAGCVYDVKRGRVRAGLVEPAAEASPPSPEDTQPMEAEAPASEDATVKMSDDAAGS
ncbi:MAG TPA: MqnA/MqnD/SBP family protein [bacterium]|nr:MqnA/MqnD/SBP family protein [bacterium]